MTGIHTPMTLISCSVPLRIIYLWYLWIKI